MFYAYIFKNLEGNHILSIELSRFFLKRITQEHHELKFSNFSNEFGRNHFLINTFITTLY